MIWPCKRGHPPDETCPDCDPLPPHKPTRKGGPGPIGSPVRFRAVKPGPDGHPICLKCKRKVVLVQDASGEHQVCMVCRTVDGRPDGSDDPHD